ncbi:MAG: four helix bundle protein [Oceanospirillaceae bacterium]|nr:four helix bundle protein [Oceanospirillaceae bacterium]
MSTGFENLDVWKLSARLSVDIYKHFSHCNDFGFKDQITRSSLSIPSNIAEGNDRSSNKDNVKFLFYAKGSCAELRTQIYIGSEIGYIEGPLSKVLIQETIKISKMLTKLISSLRE